VQACEGQAPTEAPCAPASITLRNSMPVVPSFLLRHEVASAFGRGPRHCDGRQSITRPAALLQPAIRPARGPAPVPGTVAPTD